MDRMLRTHLRGLFPGGIHILPPFPSTSDRGFAPTTYMEIAPEFGTWDDVRRIAEASPVLLDLMVNHVSAESAYFQDYLKRGGKSEYADLFIPLSKVWPRGEAPADEVQAIFRRRDEPFSDFRIEATGATARVWTTFGAKTPSDQVDIDVHARAARRLLAEFMGQFARNGVGMVRLDAVGYVIKKRGTSCFFVEPEIYGFLEWISGVAASLGLEVLPEVHAEPEIQSRLAKHGYWIYDFILPYLVLDALIHHTAARLKAYLKSRPQRQFTMLDCHDGVPIKPDLNGLYAGEDARRVVAACVERGARLSRVLSPAHQDPDGFDVHQICGTYYSLVGGDDEAYLAARAMQFFAPGVPQVYYTGLLAGSNDEAAAERTGDGRELNRHNYGADEVEGEVRREVVQRLMRLIRFRNEHPAFDGRFRVEDSEEEVLALAWEKGASRCELRVDLERNAAEIRQVKDGGKLTDFGL